MKSFIHVGSAIIVLTLIAVASPIIVHAATKAAPDYKLSAAKGPYFTCDDRVVEDRWQLERFVVPPTRHPKNPLVVREHSWEGTGPHMGGSVLFDPQDRMFKMWYSVWSSNAYYNKLPFSYNVCYAESTDGISWRKPMLGLFDCDGSKQNNCIHLGTDKTQNIDVCLNPKPRVHPENFLAIHNQKGGVFVSSSSDGKAFTFLSQTPAISYHSDTHNNFVYDEVRDLWLLFCRPRAYAGDHKRRVSVQESRDLKTWTHERNILVPTETDKPEFYGMTVFRRGDLFFGLLQTYDRATGFMHSELAWSGDGQVWNRIPTHPPFLERGPAGSWEAGMVMPAESPVVVGDEMRFYYGGFPLPHDTKEENVAAIGLAVSERDRLIGVRPVATAPGFLMTRPLTPPRKSTLVVNAVVRQELRAEIRNDGNKVVPGFSFDDCDPVTEAGFAKEITWKGRVIGDVALKEMRVFFRLTDAQLFTFDFARSLER